MRMETHRGSSIKCDKGELFFSDAIRTGGSGTTSNGNTGLSPQRLLTRVSSVLNFFYNCISACPIQLQVWAHRFMGTV
jgi:hypothetical protein